jgi:hypothetical protein
MSTMVGIKDKVKDSQSQDIENAKAYWQEYINNAKA